MEYLSYITILGIFVVIIILLRRKPEENKEKLAIMEDNVSRLVKQNDELREVLDKKLSESQKNTYEHLSHTAKEANKLMSNIHNQSQKVLTDVSEKLIKLDETNKQVINFSGQLQDLQNILKNPKHRGVLGEYYLEEILKNVLPPSIYQMQYKIGKDSEGNDMIVDAALFINDKILPIDSKFSLETYEKIINSSDASERETLEKTT